MGEDNIGELTREAEVKKTVTLEPKEAKSLSILLNIELRKLEKQSDLFGKRTDPKLSQEAALPLNEVFKQLAGRDHDVYKKVSGPTMPETKQSNTIHIGDNERTAVLSLLDWEMNPENSGSRSLQPDYKRTLVNIRQKFAV